MRAMRKYDKDAIYKETIGALEAQRRLLAQEVERLRGLGLEATTQLEAERKARHEAEAKVYELRLALASIRDEVTPEVDGEIHLDGTHSYNLAGRVAAAVDEALGRRGY